MELGSTHREQFLFLFIFEQVCCLCLSSLVKSLCFIANRIFIAGMKLSTRPLLSCSCKSKPYSAVLVAGSASGLVLPFMVAKSIQTFFFSSFSVLFFFHSTPSPPPALKMYIPGLAKTCMNRLFHSLPWYIYKGVNMTEDAWLTRLCPRAVPCGQAAAIWEKMICRAPGRWPLRSS